MASRLDDPGLDNSCSSMRLPALSLIMILLTYFISFPIYTTVLFEALLHLLQLPIHRKRGRVHHFNPTVIQQKTSFSIDEHQPQWAPEWQGNSADVSIILEGFHVDPKVERSFKVGVGRKRVTYWCKRVSGRKRLCSFEERRIWDTSSTGLMVSITTLIIRIPIKWIVCNQPLI